MLLRLRNRALERVLWVDAVCINETDDQEKEHQIQYMFEIYSLANRVVVWLGESVDGSDAALEHLRAIAVDDFGNKDDSDDEGTGNASEDGDSASIASDDIETIDPAWQKQEDALKLLQRSWFRRMWVSIAIHCPLKSHHTSFAPYSRSLSRYYRKSEPRARFPFSVVEQRLTVTRFAWVSIN